jgi:hypothetical protein
LIVDRYPVPHASLGFSLDFSSAGSHPQSR